MLQSRPVQKLEFLILRHNSGLVLNVRKVMEKQMRETLPKNQHEGETEGILQGLVRHQVANTRNPADSKSHQRGMLS